MSYNSQYIDLVLVAKFKDSLRPSLKFPGGIPEKLALATALEELAVELRQDAVNGARPVPVRATTSARGWVARLVRSLRFWAIRQSGQRSRSGPKKR